MSFEVIATEPFERKARRLAKKYKSLPSDLLLLITVLENEPQTGQPIGKNCFKVRMAITSKGKGKSGGARIITYLKISNKLLYLLDIYDKSEQLNITDKELELLVDLLSK